ncbi:hypothetical protein [Marinobacter guineae]|uniref:hypothetical protein n=1 Tax=Marinobacter guineae TaxID=432303 RepID=UPI0014765E9B|nr:hypothetical protein [Marinobacter guineae]
MNRTTEQPQSRKLLCSLEDYTSPCSLAIAKAAFGPVHSDGRMISDTGLAVSE